MTTRMKLWKLFFSEGLNHSFFDDTAIVLENLAKAPNPRELFFSALLFAVIFSIVSGSAAKET
jgi:hypothetical protein